MRSQTKLLTSIYIFFTILLLAHLFQLARHYAMIRRDFDTVNTQIYEQFRKTFLVPASHDPAICNLRVRKMAQCTFCDELIEKHLPQFLSKDLRAKYVYFDNKITMQFSWKSDASVITNRDAYYPITFDNELLCHK